MKKYFKYSAFLCLYCSFASAEDIKNDSYYFSLGLGSSHSKRTGGDFYKTNLGNSNFQSAELGYKINNKFRLGVGVDYRNGYKLNFVENDNLDYKYQQNMKVSAFSTMLNAYYDICNYYSLTPYIVGGIGASVNKVYDNKIYAYYNGESLSSSVSNNSKTSLATKIGLGVRYQLNKNFDAGLQYQYVDLGKFKTGNVLTFPSGDSDNEVPKTGSIKSKEMLFFVTYKF